MPKHTKRRRDLNVYERAGELQPTRDRLAQAIVIARRYSRQCDAYRAELVRLRHDPAPQVDGPGGFLAVPVPACDQ